MQNVHFRRALAMGLDRGAYLAQQIGDDLKYASMRNSYTPGNFVTLEEEVTVVSTEQKKHIRLEHTMDRSYRIRSMLTA